MAKQELPTTTGDEITLQFRAGRLLQILYATEVALMVIALQRFMLGAWEQTVIVIGVAIALFSVYFAAKKGKVDFGATILLSVLTLAITYFMWRYEGTKDETLLAFPTILIFAVIIGNRILFLFLLGFMLANIFVIGYLNGKQIYINDLTPTNLDSAILICVILMLVGFSIWILSSDLRSVLDKLSRENLRVLRSQKQVKKLLHHDALTNLPNRILARDRFEHAVLQSKRNGTLVSILFVDLDNFKNINDSLGHTAGDNFLVELSKKLVDCLRKTDSVCRLGGDEFLIVLEGLKSRQRILQIVEKIIEVIKQPIQVEGNSIAITGSIGVAVAPDDGNDFDSISRKADMAMYRAKDAGKNSFRFYDNQMNIDAQENISLVADLQKAIKDERLHVVFQPKVDLVSCKTVGAEALVRWHHPERGNIPPVEFIPLAESSGLIVELGEWILKESCRQCVRWNEAGLENVPVAVNVSSIQFKRGNMEQRVFEILEQTGLSGNLLELELTESLLFEDSENLVGSLAELRRIGVQFSIDDFGTGYSNLGYLKNFQVSALKIDQSFVRKVLESPQDKAIVTAIIQMANSLNMQTVAEGIETAEIHQLFKQLKCDLGQGYFWAKPMSADEFLHFARKGNCA